MQNATSPHYDENYYRKSQGTDFTEATAYKHICEAFTDLKDATFLDVGCGAGKQLKPFEVRFSFLIGVDISIMALRKAKALLQSADFIQADARSLPFVSGSIDAGMSISMIEHLTLEDARKVLAEIYRVVKHDSPFVFVTPKVNSFVYRFNLCRDPTHIHLFTINEIRDVLVSAGFKIKRLFLSSLTQKFGPFKKLLKCEIVCVVQAGTRK